MTALPAFSLPIVLPFRFLLSSEQFYVSKDHKFSFFHWAGGALLVSSASCVAFVSVLPSYCSTAQAMPGPFRACVPRARGFTAFQQAQLPQGTQARLTQSLPDRATGRAALSRAGSDLGKVALMLKGDQRLDSKQPVGMHTAGLSAPGQHTAQLSPSQRTLEFSIASVPRAALQAWVIQTEPR